MLLNNKALKAATATGLSVALISASVPSAMAADSSSDGTGGAVTASSGALDDAARTGISIVSSLVGLAISYAFWGTVYNFARSQNWINNVPVAPGLPNFNRP